jgi:hypothetical protein
MTKNYVLHAAPFSDGQSTVVFLSSWRSVLVSPDGRGSPSILPARMSASFNTTSGPGTTVFELTNRCDGI